MLLKLCVFYTCFILSMLLLHIFWQPTSYWVKRKLQQLQLNLHHEFIFLPKHSLQKVTLLWCVLLLLCFALLPSSLCMFFTFLWVTAPIAILSSLRKRRQKKFCLQLVHFLPGLAGALRVGSPFEQGLAQCLQNQNNPLQQEFELLLKQRKLGLSLEKSLHDLCLRIPKEEVILFTQAVSLSLESGSSLSNTIDGIAKNIEKRFRLSQKLLSITASHRMQGKICIATPFAFVGICYLLAPGFITPLWESELGPKIAVYALVSSTLGGLAIGKISHKEFLR